MESPLLGLILDSRVITAAERKRQTVEELLTSIGQAFGAGASYVLQSAFRMPRFCSTGILACVVLVPKPAKTTQARMLVLHPHCTFLNELGRQIHTQTRPLGKRPLGEVRLPTTLEDVVVVLRIPVPFLHDQEVGAGRRHMHVRGRAYGTVRIVWSKRHVVSIRHGDD